MVKCKFCGKEIALGTGKLFIKNDGRAYNFCSNKCEKNMFKLGRKAREIKWTQEHQDLKKSEKDKKSDKK